MSRVINLKKGILAVILSFLCISGLYAGVNKKNGNYYISYTDILGNWVGTHQLEVIRTYNSKSVDNGLFGYGWGSEWETWLEANSDGSLVVHENGSGADTVFWKEDSLTDSDIPLGMFEEALVRMDWVRTAKQLQKYLNGISVDAEIRNRDETRLRNGGLLEVPNLVTGDIFWNYSFGISFIVIVDTGYMRLFDNDSNVLYESYDHQGRLVKVGYVSGHDLTLSYDSEGRIVFANLGSESCFQLSYAGGHLSEIRDVVSGDSATYEFEGSDLVSATNTSGTNYRYTYDNNHNLTAIDYQDDSRQTITYEKKTQFTSSVTDRYGDVTRYYYGDNTDDGMDYWAEVVSHADTRNETRERWRWVIAADSSGNTYIRLLETVRDGFAIGVERNAEDLISAYILGADRTRFDFRYGSNGRLERIEGDGVRVDYSYGNRQLESISYDFRGERGRLSFLYGTAGLREISSDNGSFFSAEYSDDKRLESVEIRLTDGTEIHVGYDEEGEVSQVADASGWVFGSTAEALDDYQNRIFRAFFEFYQFQKPYTLIYWDGEFVCGDCTLGFQNVPGRFQGLARNGE